jgi:formate--tetrahydrofolate ligase
MKQDLLPIAEIAAKLDIPEKYFEPIGRYGGKVSLGLLGDPAFPRRGKLILVTATTPTVSGEGKTVTSIGLTQGLDRVLRGTGRRVVLTSREPSLGPVFGMKGGAAGGGLSQVEPSEKINLHFHGDFHAITSAHNLLAALLDAHIFHGNALQIAPETVSWPRALDMNDRGLRRMVTNVAGPKKDGDAPREGSNQPAAFVITAASEIMAILALARDRDDLRARLGAIIVAETKAGEPVRASDLGAVGPMMALLTEAIEPNLVQTTEGTPAFVHAGPFANIAHGTSSVISQQIALRLADYAVNECGFAADLGLEKYMDIVTRVSGIAPAAAVLVTTAQSLKNQGDAMAPDSAESDALGRGFANLAKHVSILQGFGLPVVVAINRFPKDTPDELERLKAWCDVRGLPHAVTEAFTRGSEGAEDLARTVLSVIDEEQGDGIAPQLRTTYPLEASLKEKIEAVACTVYGADGVDFSDAATAALERLTRWGYGELPVCIAKTQYSLSDDPKLAGAPRGWRLRVAGAALSAGAGFVVVTSGSMMLMPGLPKASRADGIDVDADGAVTGLR